jgi:hypothetical protein
MKRLAPGSGTSHATAMLVEKDRLVERTVTWVADQLR